MRTGSIFVLFGEKAVKMIRKLKRGRKREEKKKKKKPEYNGENESKRRSKSADRGRQSRRTIF